MHSYEHSLPENLKLFPDVFSYKNSISDSNCSVAQTQVKIGRDFRNLTAGTQDREDKSSSVCEALSCLTFQPSDQGRIRSLLDHSHRMFRTSTLGVQIASDHEVSSPGNRRSGTQLRTPPSPSVLGTHDLSKPPARQCSKCCGSKGQEGRLQPPQGGSAEIYEDINTSSKTRHQKLSDLKDQGPRLIPGHQRSLSTS